MKDVECGYRCSTDRTKRCVFEREDYRCPGDAMQWCVPETILLERNATLDLNGFTLRGAYGETVVECAPSRQGHCSIENGRLEAPKGRPVRTNDHDVVLKDLVVFGRRGDLTRIRRPGNESRALHGMVHALGSGVVTLALYAAIVLVANVLVVLWGAYVRATGSGAGCGDHWPLCNGEVVPRTPEVATIIEFTHRATSGLALLLVVGLIVWTWRTRPPGDRLRFWAAASGALMISEALIGAGLVLFRLVAQDTSSARPFVMIAHLLNTFALLAALALSARWAREPAARHAGDRGPRPVLLLVAMAVLVAIATTGAIAALGNTLFPVRSLAEGLQQDFSPTSHVLLRLRVLHPVLGVGGGVLVAVLAAVTAFRRGAQRVLVGAGVVLSLVILQLFCGVANLLLLAPVWLQLVHLLLADSLWIAVVLLASVARDPVAVAAAERSAGLLALVPRKG